jgi:hypothetical protein
LVDFLTVELLSLFLSNLSNVLARNGGSSSFCKKPSMFLSNCLMNSSGLFFNISNTCGRGGFLGGPLSCDCADPKAARASRPGTPKHKTVLMTPPRPINCLTDILAVYSGNYKRDDH